MIIFHDHAVVIAASAKSVRQLTSAQRNKLLLKAAKVRGVRLPAFLANISPSKKYLVIPREAWSRFAENMTKRNASWNPAPDIQRIRCTTFPLERKEVQHFCIETRRFLEQHAICVSCGAAPDLNKRACSCRNYYGPGRVPAGYLGEFQVLNADYRVVYDIVRHEVRRARKRDSNERRKELSSKAEGTHRRKEIGAIYTLQEGRCYFCDLSIGRKGEANSFQKDHLRPLAKNGTHWPINIALVCAPCNALKHDKTEETYWRAMVRRKGKPWVAQKRANNKEALAMKQWLTEMARARHAARKELRGHDA